MLQNRAITLLVVLASLLLAMILRIIPIPHWLFVYNPDWVLLFLIYWSIAVPERVGVGYAWVTGLFCDALTGRLLGQQALAYSVVAFISVKMHLRLRSYSVYQQALSVMLLLLLDQFILYWTQKIKSENSLDLAYWSPSFSGAAVWPVIFLLLRRLRRHYHIA